MEYGFLKEYKKAILCFLFAVILLCAQYFLKYDLNEIIRQLFQVMAIGLGAGTVRYSVLKTSERERLNSKPVNSPDSKKFYKPDGIQSFFFIFIITAFLAGSVTVTGCSSNQVCFSCQDKVLNWQGNITGFTQGRYIETACFKLDLWKIIQQISAGELTWEDFTKSAKIEVVVKDGEFCDPNDKSYYKITLQSDEADSTKKVIYTRKDAIILK